MAQTKLIQNSWRKMIQDIPRYALPQDAAWNIQDYIPNLGDSLRKRGGWSYASPALSAVASSATYAKAVATPNFTGGRQLVAFTDNGKSVKITDPSTQTQISATSNTPLQTPVMFDNLLIVTDDDGTTAPQKYDGTTQAALGGSPPAGQFTAVYKGRLWLGNTSAQKERLYASGILNAESWDTTYGYQDFSYPITGVAALPNAMLVFMADRTARVRGSSPPPGGDLTVDDPLFEYGCSDARSIATSGPYCVFANPQGVYVTSGTNIPEDLTKSCGLKNLWRTTLAGYAASTWTIAGSWYQGLYWVTVMNASTFKDAFVFDPVERMAWRNTNIKGMGFSHDPVGSEELYFASRAADRICSISSLYSPAAGVKNDADGTAVTPILETPYFWDMNSGDKRWKNLYLRYDIRDAASDNPVLTVSYITDPNGSYTAISPTLAETTAYTNMRLPLNVAAGGIGFKLAQTNASTDTRIAAILADVHAREPSRV